MFLCLLYSFVWNVWLCGCVWFDVRDNSRGIVLRRWLKSANGENVQFTVICTVINWQLTGCIDWLTDMSNWEMLKQLKHYQSPDAVIVVGMKISRPDCQPFTTTNRSFSHYIQTHRNCPIFPPSLRHFLSTNTHTLSVFPGKWPKNEGAKTQFSKWHSNAINTHIAGHQL